MVLQRSSDHAPAVYYKYCEFNSFPLRSLIYYMIILLQIACDLRLSWAAAGAKAEQKEMSWRLLPLLAHLLQLGLCPFRSA